ncbi:chemotaxis protein CheB [Pedobacter sp. SYSU D00535]|uniref:chemotaxis protein CheB n=1 Tax=Pedobacter sp. SYSU D00535 TaxID=2810308 RepID=UPI001A95F7B6|nr:chemotaxis protein CheB [Pedobacter sp. SYSU D00535]
MAENGVGSGIEAVVIGGSAGSLNVILNTLPLLTRQLKLSIIIVLHRKSSYDSSLANLLGGKTTLPVKEADEKEPILPGKIYLAPADYHLLIEKDKTFSLDYSEKIHYSRPSLDATFQTAAEVYRSGLAGLLLSGANSDGAEGLRSVKANGGLTAIQDPEDAEVSYMPDQALSKMKPDYLLSAKEIAGFLNDLSQARSTRNKGS